MVSEDCLEDIGLDANSISNADGRFKPAIVESPASTISETYSFLLDDPNVSFLLKAVQANEDSAYLTSPKVTVLDGKEATFSIHNQVSYISGYTEPNRPSDEPEPEQDSVTTGVNLQLTPKISPDKKYIVTNIVFELSSLLGFQEGMYKEKYQYKIPEMGIVKLTTRTAVLDGGTVLVGGQKITAEEDGRKVQKELIVLIKAKRVDSKSIGTYGGGYGFGGYGGYGGGYGGSGGPLGYGGYAGGYVGSKEADSEKGQPVYYPASRKGSGPMGYGGFTGGYGGYRIKDTKESDSPDSNTPAP
jgi:hypothetical protein